MENEVDGERVCESERGSRVRSKLKSACHYPEDDMRFSTAHD